MQIEGQLFNIFIISYLQLSFKKMQYLKTMTLPNLANSIFQSSPYQQGHAYYQKNIKYTIPSKNPISNNNPRSSVINKPIKIINSNNMHEQVSQFNKKNFFEFCLKVSIIWLISAILMMSNIINFTFGVSIGIFSFGVLIPSHNVIQSTPIRKWVNLILMFATLIIVYVIFMGILNILDKQLASNLDKTQLSLIPCIIITHVLVICYNFQPLLTIQCRKKFKQSLYYYSTSLSDLFTEILHLNLIIIKVYSLSFLATYVIIAWVNYYHILMNANIYLNIFHPYVLISQFFTFFYIIIIYHFMIYMIDSVISQKLLSILYKSKNRYMKIPTMIQLLKVSPTEQMVKQLKANGLLVYFNLFSKQQSRISNNLNFQFTNNIYERSLSWILKQIIYKGGNIKNKIQMYCNPSTTYITEVKKQTNFWDYIKQFSHLEFSRTLKILYEINRKIQELNVKRKNRKSIFTDLFYDIRLWYYEIQILRLAILCGQFLKMCNLIFEIICSAEINLKVEGGLSVILYQEIEQIRMLAEKIQKTEWVNEIIRLQMQILQCKTGYILRQSGN